jgi:hypothetical protein
MSELDTVWVLYRHCTVLDQDGLLVVDTLSGQDVLLVWGTEWVWVVMWVWDTVWVECMWAEDTLSGQDVMSESDTVWVWVVMSELDTVWVEYHHHAVLDQDGLLVVDTLSGQDAELVWDTVSVQLSLTSTLALDIVLDPDVLLVVYMVWVECMWVEDMEWVWDVVLVLGMVSDPGVVSVLDTAWVLYRHCTVSDPGGLLGVDILSGQDVLLVVCMVSVPPFSTSMLALGTTWVWVVK